MAFLDKWIDCENKERLPIDELIRGCVRKDANGKEYFNVVLSTFTDADNAEPGIDCDNAQLETVETVLRKCFVFDENDNLALRLGTTDLP